LCGNTVRVIVLENACRVWENPIVKNRLLKTSTLDKRRRLVMPPECPADSEVLIQALDDSTWLVKRIRPERGVKMVAIPIVARLPSDPDEEAKETKIVRNLSRRLPSQE
jgi:hypothetical protein